MKKVILSIALALVSVVMVSAATVFVSADITASTTWLRTNKYILTGANNFLKVRPGAVLTIQSGTKILSDGPALVIMRGAQIVAIGTKAKPITFSSSAPTGARAPGDWGGLLLLGAAPSNLANPVVEGGLGLPDGAYGGNNAADNSGTLKYVRIEYAGIPFLPDNETNSLTMAGVGSGTTISYVQTSFGGDDGFEWFGGTVNCDHLVAYANQDDDFDSDNGFSGFVQYCVGVRDPGIADNSTSNGFESDNDATGSGNSPITSAVFDHITVFGPIQSGNTGAGSLFNSGIFARRNTQIDVTNAVVVGWPNAVGVPVATTNCANLSSSLVIKNCVFAGNTNLVRTGSCTTPTDLAAYLTNPLNKNTVLTNAENAQYTDPYNWTNVPGPNFRLLTTSPCKTGGTVPVYRGAFPTGSDWTDTWTRFDPQSVVYADAPATDRDELEVATIGAEVYPNPSNGAFALSFNLEQASSNVRISIIDLLGKTISTKNIAGTKGENYLDINERLATGTYFVRIQSDKAQTQTKVIVR